MAEHDWIPSTLGHGETMCSRCSITNREAAVLGELNVCSAPPPQPANDQRKYTQDEIDHMMNMEEDCSNCGGEGLVYDCIDGQCLNAEDGCDLCASRCDWCRDIPTTAVKGQ